MRTLAGYTFILVINDNDVDDVLANLPTTLYQDSGTATHALIQELGIYVSGGESSGGDDARRLFEECVEEPVVDVSGNPSWDFQILSPDGPDMTARIYPIYWGAP